jgi:hypothetical protein
MRQFLELAVTGAVGEGVRCIVCVDHNNLQARLSSHLEKAPSSGETSHHTPCKNPSAAAPARRRLKPWYEHFALTTRRKYRLGASWRDASPRLRAQFAHYALIERGDHYAMALHLGHDIMARAFSAGPGAKRFLSQRLSYHLAAALHQKPEFWFMLEVARGNTPRLHLHGGISCKPTEVKAVRRALRRAGGEFDMGARRFQANLQKDPDDGLVTYAFKNPFFLTSRKSRRKVSGATWAENPFFITGDLKREAGQLYEAARGLVTNIGGQTI